MNVRSNLITVVFVLVAACVSGQQLLIMKKGKVIARFNPGDELLFQFKNEKQANRVVIQSLREFYFITTANDSIQYLKIGRILFRNPQKQKWSANHQASSRLNKPAHCWATLNRRFCHSSPLGCSRDCDGQRSNAWIGPRLISRAD